MVNYSPLVKAVDGLQKRYSKDFEDYAKRALAIDNPLGIVFDEVDQQNRTNLFIFIRNTLSEFQSPFAAAAANLGQAIYTSSRDMAESKRSKPFPSYSPPSLTKNLLQDNLMQHWTIAGMLKEVIDGNQTIDFVGQSGAKSVLDLVRAVTDANAVADTKVKKKAKIALSAGACKFCRDTANEINGTSPGAAYDKVKFHNSCSCTLVYEYS